MDIESTAHLLLHCPTYIIERRTPMNTLVNIDNNLLDLCEPVLIRPLHFGSNSFDTAANTNVLNATIEYILSTKRFDEPLFQWKQKIFKQCYESVYSVFIVVTCIICKFLFCFVRTCFIPGYPYSFGYPVIVSFNFTVYDIIYIYIYIYKKANLNYKMVLILWRIFKIIIIILYDIIICNIAYLIKNHETLTTVPTIHVYINRVNNRLVFKTML